MSGVLEGCLCDDNPILDQNFKESLLCQHMLIRPASPQT